MPVALNLAFEGILSSNNGPLVDTATHLMQAMSSANEQPGQIIEIGQRALTRAPHHPDLWFEIGRALLSANAFQQSADALLSAFQCMKQNIGDQSQTRLTHRLWEAHELLGRAYWGAGQYTASYESFLQALPTKPEDSAGWPLLLNSVCALAIELKDHDRLPGLLDRLLARADAPLGMFFFELDRIAGSQGADAARAFLLDGISRCPRMTSDPEYAARAQKLGIQ